MDAKTRALQANSTAHVLKGHIEPTDDIADERRRATFKVHDLTKIMLGSQRMVETRIKLSNELAKTDWGNKEQRYFLAREEKYVAALKGLLGIWNLLKNEGYSLPDGVIMRQLLDLPSGFELHIGMFIPSLISQATEEQQEEWLTKAVNLEIIGTYAQTELGHGTFVRGLETTSTYDPATQEFILHSPTLTSTKWWPGGMAKTATHAIVMARLFINQKDYGPHGFIVQLRDLDNHLPMKGIKLGDIGPKFGYAGVDNGFMVLDHVRIPRKQMLMRFSKVTPEGQYVPPPPANAKASYATMLYVRSDIVMVAGLYLARAATIATRYAAVRRQTSHAPGEKEWQVLDYQNVSHTLLPLVSAAYALNFTGKAMKEMYTNFEKARDAGDFSSLPELHALSSGLKALCTNITSDGIEACRRTCGGHGYSELSGLPSLLANYVQNVTWEGDNNVLYLQSARYLVKAISALQEGRTDSLTGSAAYLVDAVQQLKSKCQACGPSCWCTQDIQLHALRHVAARRIVEAATMLQRLGGGKLAVEGHVWNTNSVALIKAARAHSYVCLAEIFYSAIAGLERAGSCEGATLAVLRQVAALFAVSTLESSSGDLMEDGYVEGSQLAGLRECLSELLTTLRPNAVPLVDSFGLTDYELNSALGRQDGDVYRALLEMAQHSPLNRTEEGPGWEVLKHAMGKTGGVSRL